MTRLVDGRNHIQGGVPVCLSSRHARLTPLTLKLPVNSMEQKARFRLRRLLERRIDALFGGWEALQEFAIWVSQGSVNDLCERPTDMQTVLPRHLSILSYYFHLLLLSVAFRPGKLFAYIYSI
jgi:hypothetical protein